MNRLLFLYLILPLQVFAQSVTEAVPMEHEQLVSWNRIENEQISNDGVWVLYTLRAEEGDPQLVISHAGIGSETRFPRSDRGKFSSDNKYAVFFQGPASDTLKALRRAKTKDEDLPKDTLVILRLSDNKITRIPDVQSYQLPQKWPGWIAYLHEPATIEAEESENDSTEVAAPKKENKKNGSRLSLVRLNDGQSFDLGYVTHYLHAEDSPGWIARSTGDDSIYQAGIYYFPKDGSDWQSVYQDSLGNFGDMAISHQGTRLAFLVHSDTTESRIPPFGLHYWEEGDSETTMVADTGSSWLYTDWILSEHRTPFFSEDDRRLFFGIAPEPILPDTSLLPEEIVQVEVWAWQDERLYPQQMKQLESDRKENWLAMYDTENQNCRIVQDSSFRQIQLGDEGKARFGLLLNDEPYYRSVSWEGFPSRTDLVRCDLQTGQIEPLTSGVKAMPRLSPGGNYAYWYNYADSLWQAMDLENPEVVTLTDNRMVAYFDEENDTPSDPGPYGLAGWTKEDDHLILYDRYDLWLVDPDAPETKRKLTNGREEKIRYRYIDLDKEERFIDPEGKLLLHAFYENDKTAGYAWLDLQSGAVSHHHFGPFYAGTSVLKARDNDWYIFTLESFRRFPDLLASGPGFNDPARVSDANPQQFNYIWGEAELVEWVAPDGNKLQGMLIKPGNFDPDKQYPMIVNFYERSSDGLHRHRAPYPHRSTINYSFYASRGYLIFNPDVPYTVGYPGESAYNAVMSGVTHLIDRGFVDTERIGLQGHSWGGYQVAYLITKTDMFACAESGAPVVNMTSAYGGIRWGTGLSRMFQYEHTQSRIGGTLWDSPMRYLENSPLFYTDRINTPVLILHNDQDGAVPWYQGIEWFVALRRLNKPAWMLNYNDEPHWPLKLQNRVDFNIRMAQFFDHYLMGAARPKWMDQGVPAMEKGIRQGLELLEEE